MVLGLEVLKVFGSIINSFEMRRFDACSRSRVGQNRMQLLLHCHLSSHLQTFYLKSVGAQGEDVQDCGDACPLTILCLNLADVYVPQMRKTHIAPL